MLERAAEYGKRKEGKGRGKRRKGRGIRRKVKERVGKTGGKGLRGSRRKG